METKKAYSRLMSLVLKETTAYFHSQGFSQLMPVVLSPITDPLGPDPNSTVIKTGEIEYLGQKLTLTQSMILHKQIAIKQGHDKIFIISPNVRLEHPDRGSSGRHLFEFSQVDFEIAHAKKEDVFALMEGFMSHIVEQAKLQCRDELSYLNRHLHDIKGPFPKYTTHELEEIYGEDWEHAASMENKTPFWAICHKREFYDKQDPEQPGHYLNYDMVYPEGFGEALSGAEREYEYDKIMARVSKDQLKMERYAPYLEFAKQGLVPSAGGGFGVERLVKFLSGAKHVGDVQLFRRVPGERVIV
ncbi:MAG: asparagine synthetase A [Candidatus Micrarchaeota archaeon]|nr:asparagine synthetase A [Candidatus Micrarchaeota archaeon]